MDYKHHYEKLISTRKNRFLKEGEYYEKHHILPKCIGGSDDQDNLIYLTAREHYIAHWLLIKFNPDIWKLYFAFFKMSKTNNKNGRIISSKQFSRGRAYLAHGAKIRAQFYNPGKSENSRKKARERMLSEENPMKKHPDKNPFLGKSYVRGKKWYNNGIVNIYLSPHEEIPEGFTVGMKPYKRIRKGAISDHKG